MDRTELNRREFQRLGAAAFGGMLLGAAGLQAVVRADENPLLSDPHVCRGINTCKGKGASGKNDCAGQGTCATAEKHTCHAANQCKGQGGCGAHPGENACKAQGACNVPLKDAVWTKARKRFEQLMKADKKPFGKAPPKG
jgi:hypothetical protein